MRCDWLGRYKVTVIRMGGKNASGAMGGIRKRERCSVEKNMNERG